MPRFNIVLIQSDQHRADCIAANGHRIVQTPHLDRLAAEGTNFTRTFCPIPLCGPARISSVTGQWAHNHGSLVNHGFPMFTPVADNAPSYANVLREAGYYLEYVAKWHVHPSRGPAAFGFHRDRWGQAFEDEYTDWRRASRLPDRPVTDAWFNRCSSEFGFDDPGITAGQSRLGWSCTEALRALERCAGQAKPFFFTWQPPEPHFPCIVPEPYASMYDPAAIPPWPGFSDSLEGKPVIQRIMRAAWHNQGWEWDRWAPSVARYLGEITLLDAQVGRVLEAIERLGIAGNTVVIYTADHGDMTGNHGLIDKHNVMYDDITRVPLIIRWPGRGRPGQQCNAFVTNALDLAVTYCDIARTAVPEAFEGTNLAPLVDGSGNGRDAVFCEYFGQQFGLFCQKMVRTAHRKYIWNATAEDELYDLEKDPAEISNRAADPAYAADLGQLRSRLVTWMETTGDPLLNPWNRTILTGRS